tara:strand:+ start:7534 stop:9459 length:1926 start_codon:yes stop_codon:yes gene_type:complete
LPLTKLTFRPGINKETTSYSNEGGWFDSDKVRFRAGYPEKIGGWLKKASSAILGSARALHNWSALDNNTLIGIGTHLKYYLLIGQTFFDITPIRTTVTGEATFAATNGSSTITVTDTGHGAVLNDFVTFTSASSLGGNITAAVLNQEYQIASVPDNNTYTIQARTAGTTIASITTTSGLNPTLVTASGSDSGNGGGSTVAAYQLNVGIDVSMPGVGWGAGSWGRGTWNSDADTAVSTQNLRIWTHDNFGEDLLINIRDGQIAYWDRSGGTSNRAVLLNSLTGSSSAPTIAKQVIVSDVDRHVIAFGCDPADDIGTQDPLLIRFADQGSLTDWASTATNTAGDLKLGVGSEIIKAVETRQQILVFTETSIHSMQFIGPPFTFGLSTIADNTTIAGPLAVTSVQDTVYWMGKNEFYMYTGTVQRMPCSVRDHVFSDLNWSQGRKIASGLNSSFAEIWWFYPSETSTENDKYVVYNYEQQIWYTGSLARTAWLDRGIEQYPVSVGTDHYVYDHENGFDDGSTEPPSALPAHIESSQFDIGDGDQFTFVHRLIPDITFRNSTNTSPSASFTLQTRAGPGSPYAQNDPSTITRTAAETTTTVEQFTDLVHVRLRGRSFALKVSSSDVASGWRLGSPRVDVRPDGRR